MSDRFKSFIQHEIDTINLHLPVKVISLKVIDRIENKGVKLRDGSYNEFDDKELELIKSLIDKSEWSNVLLPIIITRRRDLGAGAFVVSGSDQNLYIILKLLGEKLPNFFIWKLNKPQLKIIYRHHTNIIRKKLPTTTVIAFS